MGYRGWRRRGQGSMGLGAVGSGGVGWVLWVGCCREWAEFCGWWCGRASVSGIIIFTAWVVVVGVRVGCVL